MAQTVYGSVDRPVMLDHFHRIREVHWSSGIVGIVTIDYDQLNSFNVLVDDPAEASADGTIEFGPIPATKEDYENKFILDSVNPEVTGSIVLETEIPDTWFIEAEVLGPIDDRFGNVQDAVNGLTAELGFPPQIHVIGGKIIYDKQIVTQPNGHQVEYFNGFHSAATVDGFDFSNSQNYGWYTVRTIPEYDGSIFRRSWLVNFNKKVVSGKITMGSGSIAYINKYSLKTYPYGTKFIWSGGVWSPENPPPPAPLIVPKISISGEIGSGFNGVVRRFNSSRWL